MKYYISQLNQQWKITKESEGGMEKVGDIKISEIKHSTIFILNKSKANVSYQLKEKTAQLKINYEGTIYNSQILLDNSKQIQKWKYSARLWIYLKKTILISSY